MSHILLVSFTYVHSADTDIQTARWADTAQNKLQFKQGLQFEY